MKQVIIYSTPTCHFCHAAKEFFKEHNVAFTDYNVSTDRARAKEMVEKSGQMGVPVILIDGEVTVGFEEGHLKHLLGIR